MINYKEERTVVIDIEVAAYDFDSTYDDSQKEYLLKYTSTDEEKAEAIKNLVFNPFTSKIVAIGLLDITKNKGCVYLNADGSTPVTPPEEFLKYICDDEVKILERFWLFLENNNIKYFVTFNGREFDFPFLMLRSFVLGIKPAINLMRESDFNFKKYHIDLLKELTFFKHSPQGAKRKFSLDFYCKRLGIKSSKSAEASGEMVGEMFENGEYQKIADYCYADVVAESELFKRWNELLNF
jgi:3'-5' exonuclease